jgi:DNA-binding MarR family transcriptional regulator
MRDRGTGRGDLPDISDCACATLRRAARLVTALYDEELRLHLPASQFALLSAIKSRPRCNQSMLARMLAFDKTTLSRNLALLRRNGWVEFATADGQREHVRLTKDGTRLLAVARPGWRRAQNRLRSTMSHAQWNAMWRVIRDVTNCAYQAREMKRHRGRE